MQAELFKRLAEIKARRLSGIRNWQAFLAQSLYNAAKNFIRHEDALRRQAQLLPLADPVTEDGPFCSDRNLIAAQDPIESTMRLAEIWSSLTPEMRKLAQLLLEEEGNTSCVAKRLRRPRKTVEYWIQKLRPVLEKHGRE